MRYIPLVLILGLAGCAPLPPKYCGAARENAELIVSRLSDDDIKWVGTALTKMNFRGECACPSDQASDGSKCGDRSAYSRAGGHSVACYDSDIPDSDVPWLRRRAVIMAMPISCGGDGNDQELAEFIR